MQQLRHKQGKQGPVVKFWTTCWVTSAMSYSMIIDQHWTLVREGNTLADSGEDNRSKMTTGQLWSIIVIVSLLFILMMQKDENWILSLNNFISSLLNSFLLLMLRSEIDQLVSQSVPLWLSVLIWNNHFRQQQRLWCLYVLMKAL